MKNLLSPRTLLALTIATGLTACGAGSKTYDLGGTILNLTDAAGVVLSSNGKTLTVTTGATGFVFPDKLGYGDKFNLAVTTQPIHQTCDFGLSPVTGSAGTTSTTASVLTCIQNSYTVGGAITGLTSAGLVLTNGSDVASPAANDTAFAFPTKVNDGATYGVTILTQPPTPKQTCTVTNGTGRVNLTAVTNVQITCVNG
jgi:hypothetical protein